MCHSPVVRARLRAMPTDWSDEAARDLLEWRTGRTPCGYKRTLLAKFVKESGPDFAAGSYSALLAQTEVARLCRKAASSTSFAGDDTTPMSGKSKAVPDHEQPASRRTHRGGRRRGGTGRGSEDTRRKRLPPWGLVPPLPGRPPRPDTVGRLLVSRQAPLVACALSARSQLRAASHLLKFGCLCTIACSWAGRRRALRRLDRVSLRPEPIEISLSQGLGCPAIAKAENNPSSSGAGAKKGLGG